MRWKLRPVRNIEKNLLDELAFIPEIILRMLVNRGVEEGSLLNFIRTDLRTIQNDFLLPANNIHIKRLYEVIKGKGKIIFKCDNKFINRLCLYVLVRYFDMMEYRYEIISKGQEIEREIGNLFYVGIGSAQADGLDIVLGKTRNRVGIETYMFLSALNFASHPDFDREYVLIDVETTGLNAEYNRIIELGMIKVKNFNVVDIFNTYINSGMSIPAEITRITGISDYHTADAPFIKEVIPKFLNFIKDDTLVIHNASFDLGFLNRALKENGYETLKNEVYDTLGQARTTFPMLGRYSLAKLMSSLNYNVSRFHTAHDDVVSLLYLFKSLRIAQHELPLKDEFFAGLVFPLQFFTDSKDLLSRTLINSGRTQLELFKDYIEVFKDISQQNIFDLNDKELEAVRQRIGVLIDKKLNGVTESGNSHRRLETEELLIDAKINFLQLDRFILRYIAQLSPYSTGFPNFTFMTTDCEIYHNSGECFVSQNNIEFKVKSNSALSGEITDIVYKIRSERGSPVLEILDFK